MNIFEQYGIKEVADVQFEALTDAPDGSYVTGDIVLFLDTLKVSTIETTAEVAEAKGGKGAPSLIMWDYGKAITITLEDALFSAASLALMIGGKGVTAAADKKASVRVTQSATGSAVTLEHSLAQSANVRFINLTTGARGQVALASAGTSLAIASGVAATDKIMLFYDVAVDGTNGSAYTITISPDTFPGTYKVFGDTVVRNRDGADEPFQFVIEKAKVGSEVTLTMEAEGDPSTFSMTLTVLRDNSGEMMKLIKYNFTAAEG